MTVCVDTTRDNYEQVMTSSDEALSSETLMRSMLTTRVCQFTDIDVVTAACHESTAVTGQDGRCRRWDWNDNDNAAAATTFTWLIQQNVKSGNSEAVSVSTQILNEHNNRATSCSAPSISVITCVLLAPASLSQLLSRRSHKTCDSMLIIYRARRIPAFGILRLSPTTTHLHLPVTASFQNEACPKPLKYRLYGWWKTPTSDNWLTADQIDLCAGQYTRVYKISFGLKPFMYYRPIDCQRMVCKHLTR
jgi:hypothetical protein